MKLEIKRDSSVQYNVEIDEQTVYSSQLLGEEKITASFYSASELDLRLNDFVVHQSKQYHIRDTVNAEQIANNLFKYDIVFYAEIYKLYDEMMIHLNRTSFSYTGTPFELVSLIVDSIEESGWSVGDVANITEPLSFSFDDVSCRVALTDVAQRFELEYSVSNKVISLVSRVGVDRSINFSYGRNNGAYKLIRQKVDTPFATVWRAYGGTHNLPAGYREGSDRLTLGSTYEVNTSLYGRKKGVVKFDYIYPRRTGTISSVVSSNVVVDSSLDFDLNAQSITEGSAKIVFKSGELAGQDFVITKYDATTKQITFASKKDETGYEMPNATFAVAVGDTYTLVGITMPETYVTAAETELYDALVVYANKNSNPPFSITPECDEKYIRENNLKYVIQVGDKVNVSGLQYSGAVRVQTLSYPLVNADKLTLQLSNVIVYTTQEQIVRDVKQTKRLSEDTKYRSLFAKQLAQEVANALILNQFKKTYVGDYVVMSGAFLVGNPDDGVVGGLDGSGDAESLLLFSGSDFEDREVAPARIYRNGDAYFFNAYLKGKIEADEGYFGVLQIDGLSLRNEVETEASVLFSNSLLNQIAMFGTDVAAPSEGGRRVSARYEQKGSNSLGDNVGIIARAGGSTSKNIALLADEGDSIIDNALINGNMTYTETLTDTNRLVDVSKYAVVCIEPIGSGDSGVTFSGTVKAGKEVKVINLNMGKAMFIYSTIRGYSAVTIPAGGAVMCAYTGVYWYVVGQNF